MGMITPYAISKTKIISPQRRPEIVTRPRLIDEFHDLLNKQLILLCAPAGYGKTTLLIDLALQSEIPTCWLSLDVLDQEPQRFINYFVSCIHQRFSAFGKESYSALNSLTSLEKDNERLVVTITNEIYQNIHEHFVIILDDYHFINPVHEIRIFINRFVQLAGEHCHLILSSRILPTLPELHLLVARDQVGGMGFDELVFQPEEIQALFAQNTGQILSPDEARDLAAKTEGWITSFSITGLLSTSGRQRPDMSLAKTGVDLSGYFRREVQEKQTPAIREFLLLTSLFDEVSVDLCNEILSPLITGSQRDWKSLFNTVLKNNLFAVPVGENGRWFRYHHLFQEYLQAELQEQDPLIIPEIMFRLGQYYEGRQEWDKAHHIYENINDQSALLVLIEKAGTHFIRHGRIVTLGNWLERLPISVLQETPMLLSLQGAVAHTQGDTQLGLSLLSQAEVLFRGKKENDNLALTLIRRAAVYRELGNYDQSLKDAEEAIGLTETATNPEARSTYAFAHRIQGLSWLRLGKTIAAMKKLEKALNILNSLEEENLLPILKMELGVAHHGLGNNETAIKHYLSAMKDWEKTGNLGWQATVMNNIGVLYHYCGDYEQAFEMFDRAIDYARRSGYLRAQALALTSLGDMLVDIQELDRSAECYDQALVIASQFGDSYLRFYNSISKAKIARLSHHLRLAEKMLGELFPYVQNQASPADEALFRMEYGSLLLFVNKPQQAIDEFTRAVSLYEQNGRVLETQIGRLWLAVALAASGQPDSATTLLARVFPAAGAWIDSGLLYVNAAQAQAWFDQYCPPQNQALSVRKLISRAEEFNQGLPAIRRKLRRISRTVFISPPRLNICALGTIQVTLNGKKISLADWQTRETRDLFFFFLQEDTATKEQVASAFWPDISPSRLKMRFKTGIYRLRQAIGQDTILFDGEHYRFNRSMDYEYDVEIFRDLVRQANITTGDNSAELLNKAISLVKGSYLAEIDANWVDQVRAQLEVTYHDSLLRLAEIRLKAGQAEQALEVCRTALRSNPLMEEAYRLAMRAYAYLGDRVAIARTYQTCRATLFDELGIEPSSGTKMLYEQLN
jgi:ATP/maltotriose-dependent transcriptional regulator MalT/DNA-binding SARP family transcriptional activator